MYQLHARIRDYDGATDTASVELEGLGHIDFWQDGLKIDASLNRAFLVHGAPVTLSLPDEFRLPEAIVMAVGQLPSNATIYTSTTLQRVQFGRGIIPTGNTGAGSLAVLFPVAFSSTPAELTAADDDNHGVALSAITATGFTATVAGTGILNGYLAFSWHAKGNR